MFGPYFKVMDLIVYLGLEIARLNLKFELGLPNKTSIQLVYIEEWICACIIHYIWATIHSGVVSKLLSSISISIVCNPSTIGKSALYCYTIIAPFHHWKRKLNTKGQSMSFYPSWFCNRCSSIKILSRF